MENRKNTESKTVIKIQKNDGCFFTPSLRKSPTSIHTKQICKKPQNLATPIKAQARRSGVNEKLFKSKFIPPPLPG